MKSKAEIMRCPYRKETTRYTPDEGPEQSLETFPECHRGTCPLYSNGKCARVQEEIKQALVIMDGQYSIFDVHPGK